jgi:AcrR family transcriptional regulator
LGTKSSKSMAERKSTSKRPSKEVEKSPLRKRILEAAFAAFMERGYTQTSTLEIARRAHVSKRELYAVVGKKQEILTACIKERAGKMQFPADIPVPHDCDTLAHVIEVFGAQLLREMCHPSTIAMFRLAIAEARNAPQIARALNSIGRKTTRTGLTKILADAQTSGLLAGDPVEISEHFTALLWGNLMLRLLLNVTNPPTPKEIKRRAHNATSTFLRLYSK